ncbi:MAG TPA: OB-fold nucleic acid binding domain-containing protein, partial [Burkholderiales bacterium]|nr:OB-fold nucleic acid binding domain-containing protein [Burkholderiales bacterium]
MARARSDPSPITHHSSLSGLSRSTLERLAKLGIHSQLDLVLHLPARYDDETKLQSIGAAPAGEPVLVEGRVVKCEIQFRPRRQLACHIEDGSGVLTLRFINFYQSQQAQLEEGAHVRAFGEIRQGFRGPEMIHPRYRVVQPGTPIAQVLTPVYPTTAGLSQDALRRLIAKALAGSNLEDTLPGSVLESLGLPPFEESVRLLHNPSPQIARAALEGRRLPAWRRVKFDELLAQQLSMRQHYRRRKAAGAP